MSADSQMQDLLTMVRGRDYARFLAIQLAPIATRPALYALTAFAGEMARIPSQVTEPLAGFMRFAWWSEALQEISASGAVRYHPVLEALVPVARAYPDAFAQLGSILLMGQHCLEDPENDTYRVQADHFLNLAWAQVLMPSMDESLRRAISEGSITRFPRVLKPLGALAKLPRHKHPSPWHILRVIVYGLQP